MSRALRVFTDWKIFKRVLVTLVLVLFFRFGSLITVPGATVNTSLSWDSGSFLGLMTMLGGGGLTYFSIFALGVAPYITASIIIQLLSADVIPPLARLNKQGEKGRQKIEKITRITTIFIAILEGISISIALSSSGYITIDGTLSTNEWVNYLTFTLFLVAGSMITLWIADQITMYGIGNGTSMIIYVGIVAMIPSKIIDTWGWMVPVQQGGTALFLGLMSFFTYFILTLGIVLILGFFETSERRIPIQQTGRGLQLIEDKHTYLPVKSNPAGIIPVIFASAVMTLPPLIAQFFPDSSPAKYWIVTNFSLTAPFGLTLYALLLVLFTFFYAHINIKADETAENLQKANTFIVGVKPGEDTERYLSKTITAMALIGALILTSISILPYLLTMAGMPQSIAVGGTSMIILVSVSIDIYEQLKARVIASETKSTQLKKMDKKVTAAQAKTVHKDSTILFD